MIYLIITTIVLLALVLKIFIHFEKRHDESLEKINEISKKLYEELSRKEKSLTLLNDEVRLITNFIKENDSIGEKESRKKLKYRLSEAFWKMSGKTKLQSDIDSIEFFYKKNEYLGESFKTDILNSVKEESQKYSIHSNISDKEEIPTHIRPLLDKLTAGEELSTFETMMLLEDHVKDNE